MLHWGLLTDGSTLPAWKASCIRQLIERGGFAVALVGEEPSPPESGASPSRSLSGLTDAIALLRGEVSLWDRFRSRAAKRSRALRPVDVSEVLRGAPQILRRGPSSDDELAALRAMNLDFLLDLSSSSPPGDELLAIPRYGVWSFQHGEAAGHPEAPHLKEVERADRETRVRLWQLTGGSSEGAVLRQGFFRVNAESYTRTVDRACFASAAFPARVYDDIVRNGAPRPVRGASGEPPAQALPTPANLDVSTMLARFAWRRLGCKYDRAFRAEQWSIGVVDAPASAFLSPDFHPVVEWLPTTSASRYLADPFCLVQDGELTVFVEDFDHDTERGHIAFVTRDEKGTFRPPEAAIAIDEHLSYPYLIVHRGEVYCIPESSASRQVRLYRAKRFPREWELVSVLLDDFAAVDSTVFEHGGRWWLLCTDEETGSWTMLHAFHAPDLLGPWEPHAANPVKADVRSSRPAGRPFLHEGQLYRPAQDCSRTYGGAVAINRVLRLSPTEFAEEVVRVIGPDENGPFPEGLHTLTSSGNVTVIDGKRMVFVPEAFRRALMESWESAVALMRPSHRGEHLKHGQR